MNRDLCWLADNQNLPGVGAAAVDVTDATVMAETIAREARLLFPKGQAALTLEQKPEYPSGDAFRLEAANGGYAVKSATPQGLLYGLFALRRRLAAGGALPFESSPNAAMRMLNHWDNFSGNVERGYAGQSIFYDDFKFRGDMGIVRQYARLLASVGINALSINNVNAHRLESFFVTEKHLADVKRIADVFAEYGVKTFLSINFAAPKTVGGLATADPLDAGVIKFWADICKGIYDVIPNFGGFVVKADSEGEPGPFAYGRNHDDGANMLAKAIKPYGGVIVWRCFVYNCLQDWRDKSLDRARAAYDIFKPLDGKFDDNVILQIKNGPIDFQIREPVSPLFGALTKTNHILEFQITQEYTGHQKDICYLAPMWKEVLDFDTGNGLVKHALAKNSPNPALSGVAAVVGVGMDDNWMGNKLAQANLYAYGRLCWDADLGSEGIAREWVKQTFGLNQANEDKLTRLLTTSRETYEDYNCPLSVGFMCVPHLHYGVSVDGYEYDRWGTYHYADRDGIGRDRTVATGTGYAGLYADKRFNEYEDVSKTPDELLLFFHHVPYTHKLHSGKTVVQHIYDTHFEGVEKVADYINTWESLEGAVSAVDYANVRERLDLQLKNATEWRDQINTYFLRHSGIADEHGRRIYE